MSPIDPVSASSQAVGNAISIAVARKTLDAQREQGDQMVQMISEIANLVAAQPTTDHSPNTIDTYA